MKELIRTGYREVTPADGEEALRLARESVPNLILLDMLLPKVGGPEVLRSLRTTPLTVRIPIVASLRAARLEFQTQPVDDGI